MEELPASIHKKLAEKIPEKSLYEKLTEELIRGAEEGLEVNDANADSWFNDRFSYEFMWLDKNDYIAALVRALWLAPVFAGTDYGSSRQRDMAQVWTDTARGFLGEIAVSNFLEKNFGIKTKLDTSRGNIKDYLASDVSKVQIMKKGEGAKRDDEWRESKLKISIKTTKFNGRWLDVPGAQIEHSDVFILVKIGISRRHFLAFLKSMSFLKDKLFAEAQKMDIISAEDSEALWNEIPEFYPLPVYISGFINKNDVNFPIDNINARLKGRKLKRIIVSQGVGLFTPDNIRNHESISALDSTKTLPIEIEPIIKSFTGQKFFAHSGGLKFSKDDWAKLAALI